MIIKRIINTKQNTNDKKNSRTQKTIALSLATLLNTFVGIISSMIMARVFTKVELSAYKQTLLAFNTFLPILGLGIAQGIYYFLARKNISKRRLITKCLNILIVTGLIYSLFIILGGNKILAQRFGNPQIEELLLFMIPYSIIMVPATIISPIFISEDRISTNVYFSIFGQLIISIGIVCSILVWHSAYATIIARVLLSVLVFLFGIMYIYYILPKDQINKNSICIIDILKFSIPLALSSMLATLHQQLDKWIISAICSPEEFAIFSNGAFEVPFIGAVTGAVSAVIIVDMNRYISNCDYNQALCLFKKAAEKTSKILIPLFLFMEIIANPFIRFLYTDQYIEAIPIFRVYLLLLPVRTAFYGPILIALGKSKEILFKNLGGLLVNAILSVALVKFLGTIGASVASIATIYFVNVPISFYLISKALNIKWYMILPFKQYAECFLLSIIPSILCIILDYLIADIHLILRLGMDTFVFSSAIIIIFSMYYKVPLKKLIINKIFRLLRR